MGARAFRWPVADVGAWIRLRLRLTSGDVVRLAAGHAVLTAWVTWYLAEEAWGSAPISASLTPLPPLVFAGTWGAGVLFVFAAAALLGARALDPPRVGPDPAALVPMGAATRLGLAWASAGVGLAWVAAATVPLYLALHEMGAFRLREVGACVAAYAVALTVGPALGVIVAGAFGRRRERS
jgi:hypothetical protein